MSYPPSLYHGTTGEQTARVRPDGAEADLRYPTGVKVSYLATSASTEGQFGLYRWDMSPEVTGSGAHFHRSFTESFFVLSGTVKLYDGRSWADGNAGDFLYVPQGGLHGFRNESGARASMLILFTPGAPREDYFEGLLALREGRWTPDERELADFFDRNDNHTV
jgi:mannose-6-phosphate isomerase-like protein (cupin superfamily)